MARIVYLTGSSGFLGGYLARVLNEDETVEKVYCPIRTKKGVSGPERLRELLPDYAKCIYVDPNHHDNGLPNDVTHVILNAYNTRFDEEHRFKLQSNVEPILKLLDQCKHRMIATPQTTTNNNNNAPIAPIQGITLVSTAYVQPPLPFKRYDGNYLPLLLNEENDTKKVTATEIYDKIMRMDEQFTVKDVLPDLDPYYVKNSYVFSKHLLEIMLGEKYPDLPISIVRPSIVGVPVTLDYGLTTKAAAPLLMQLSQHWICMAPKTNAFVNVVLMEDTCDDIKHGVFEAARPAQCKTTHGRYMHEIIACCADSSDNDGKLLFKVGAPHVPRVFDIQQEWLLNLIRNIEYFCAWCLFGQKIAHLLHVVYENYDFYMDHTWDFEARHKHDLVKLIVEHRPTYLENLKKLKAKDKQAVMSERFMQRRIMAFFSLFMVAVAVLVRRAFY